MLIYSYCTKGIVRPFLGESTMLFIEKQKIHERRFKKGRKKE